MAILSMLYAAFCIVAWSSVVVARGCKNSNPWSRDNISRLPFRLLSGKRSSRGRQSKRTEKTSLQNYTGVIKHGTPFLAVHPLTFRRTKLLDKQKVRYSNSGTNGRLDGNVCDALVPLISHRRHSQSSYLNHNNIVS
jgi:hypothetical protein